MPPSEAQLLSRIAAGDKGALGELLQNYHPRLYNVSLRMVGNRDDALDLSQEIFVKVFQALSRYNPEFKFSTWLFRIAGNAAIDYLRKRRPRTVPLEQPIQSGDREGVSTFEYKSPGPDPFSELRNTERGEAISRAIAGLPPEFRELITLRHFTGLSYEEIAEIKRMPLGTVKNKLFRARAVLKEWLSGEMT